MILADLVNKTTQQGSFRQLKSEFYLTSYIKAF